MTARQMVLAHARGWTEEQAQRALLAAEGRRAAELEGGPSGRRALMARAAALRARQPEAVDAAVLAREARDELERRLP